jgi:hypothetical protein
MVSDSVLEIFIYWFKSVRHDIEYATDRDGVRLVYMLVYTILAVQAVIVGTEYLSPWHKEGDDTKRRVSAATGGLPELKAILSGGTVECYFFFRTYVAKFFGLMMTSASGLMTGKEGPFVHMSAVIGRLLCGSRLFKSTFGEFGPEHVYQHPRFPTTTTTITTTTNTLSYPPLNIPCSSRQRPTSAVTKPEAEPTQTAVLLLALTIMCCL